MDYKNLIILPTDNENEAKKILQEVIYERGIVLFVVIGRSPEDRKLCEVASLLLGADDSFSQVLWARKPRVLWEVLANTAGLVGLPDSPDEVRALCLNLSDQIQKVYLRSAVEPDALEILTVTTGAGG